MRLIDECLHESLCLVAHTAGLEATHVNHLGRLDFIRLFSKMDLHAGLIVLIQSVAPSLQRDLFAFAIQFLAEREMVNSVIEVSLDRNAVHCVEYSLPTGE